MGDQNAKMKSYKQKWVFLTWPNMALTNMDLRPISSPNRENRREEKREEEEKEEEENNKRRGRREAKIKQQGMETTLSMDFVWITWNFKALYG